MNPRRHAFAWGAPLRLIAVVALLAAACAQTPGGAGTATPPSTQAAVQSPAQTGPCIDVADLADMGEPVESAMTKVTSSLAAQKVADARTAATSAADGMRRVADQVAAASPAAQAQFLAAATEIEKARDQFPAGTSLLDQAKNDLEKAFATARDAAC